MKPNKGNLLGAIHLLDMIKSFIAAVKPTESVDSATTMDAGYASTILKCWVGVGRQLKGLRYLQVGAPTLLAFVVPNYPVHGALRDTVSTLLFESQKLSETCAVLAGTPSPGYHNLNDDFAKCESAVQGVINRFLQHLKADDPQAFNKFIGDLVHY
jgi:hypothetical protein